MDLAWLQTPSSKRLLNSCILLDKSFQNKNKRETFIPHITKTCPSHTSHPIVLRLSLQAERGPYSTNYTVYHLSCLTTNHYVERVGCRQAGVKRVDIRSCRNHMSHFVKARFILWMHSVRCRPLSKVICQEWDENCVLDFAQKLPKPCNEDGG